MTTQTDGLDRATLTRWRAQLDDVVVVMKLIFDTTDSNAQRGPWFAFLNALDMLYIALAYLDEALAALPEADDSAT